MASTTSLPGRPARGPRLVIAALAVLALLVVAGVLVVGGGRAGVVGVPASTAAPATPAAQPTEIVHVLSASGPVQSGFTRYSGHVTDAATGEPLEDICVYAGPPSGCPKPYLATDADGRWAFDFPSGVSWQFNFERAGYEPRLNLTGQTLEVELARRQ
ncbi:MAG: hypothetical protein Q7S25_04600 [Candidatus Limnocylindria bacterium]|nr:hypothetical protein [Candidatus Limnocylindria bacterium]